MKARDTMNDLGNKRIPFLFCIDFEEKKPIVEPLNSLRKVLYDFNGTTSPGLLGEKTISLTKTPISYEDYVKRFETVYREIHLGNSFLVNLTIPTPITLNCSLHEVFFRVKAPYKMLLEEEFIFFSPETFVRIEDGKIYSFPMKGTIDASIKEAEKKILEDVKEKAEHATIVDLIRNDLSLISENVRVDRYRYTSRVKTKEKELIQVSSIVSGELQKGFGFGDIIFSLLPAGSISGAPKKRTIEIIKQAEKEDRGYFTGVAGVFDGKKLDSCVMIRFIENDKKGGLRYRSGGGITINSDPKKEYQEMIDKVYVPAF